MSRRTARGAGLTEQAFRCVDDRETHEGNGPTDFHERTIAPLTQCTDHIFGICDKDLRCVRAMCRPLCVPTRAMKSNSLTIASALLPTRGHIRKRSPVRPDRERFHKATMNAAKRKV